MSNIKKSIKLSFRDWESATFGFSYGSGEKHIFFALKSFLEFCGGPSFSYDFEILERELTPTVAWLLINILCKANIIDYGSSPRFGWLTVTGIRLKKFIVEFSIEELCEIVSYDSDDYIP